jgi:hypothetical protein
MSVKLLSESRGATITDEDQARIDAILAFWFKEHELSAPQIDRRKTRHSITRFSRIFPATSHGRRKAGWITGPMSLADGWH